MSPKNTTSEDQTSVEKCKASASRAWLEYLSAARLSALDREISMTIEKITTTKAQMFGSIFGASARRNNLSTASKTIHTQVTSSRTVSTSAERFSNLP